MDSCKMEVTTTSCTQENPSGTTLILAQSNTDNWRLYNRLGCTTQEIDRELKWHHSTIGRKLKRGATEIG
jgi:IS30 family transposase